MADRRSKIAEVWSGFLRLMNRWGKSRFYFTPVFIVASLLFRQPTRGLIWISIAIGLAVALYLRRRQREPEINDPKIR
jgi:hypothetical protein